MDKLEIFMSFIVGGVAGFAGVLAWSVYKLSDAVQSLRELQNMDQADLEAQISKIRQRVTAIEETRP